MEVWLKDNETGIEIGINDDGELFLGDSTSGGNYRDTLENRKMLIRDFCRATGKQSPIISADGRPIAGCSQIDFSR